jgi:ATP-binding cassette subfamily B protein
MAKAKYTELSLFWRILRQARPYWPHISGIFLVSLLSIPLKLLSPVPLKIAVDSVIGSHPLPAFLDTYLPAAVTQSDGALLTLAAGLMVAIALASGLRGLGGSVLRKYTGEKLVLAFRAKLFRHAQRLSLSYHDAMGTGDSMYRIQSDARAIQSIAISGVIPFIVAGVTLLSMLYIIFRLDWQLGLLSLVIMPVFFMLVNSTRGWMRRQSRAVKQLESTALSVVQEVLSSIRVVKAFAQEDREQERFVHHHNEGMWARLRLTIFEGSYGLLVGLTTATATAAFLFFGIRHVQSGTLTLGELLLVLGYLAQFLGPLRKIGSKVVGLQSSLASAERAFSLLDEAPDVPERPSARSLLRASGSVVFRGCRTSRSKSMLGRAWESWA